jgi:hypothetical protein
MLKEYYAGWLNVHSDLGEIKDARLGPARTTASPGAVSISAHLRSMEKERELILEGDR